LKETAAVFTGIIEEIGRVESATVQANGSLLRIAAPALAGELRPGASVALAGVCQTVLDAGAGGFRVAAEAETLRVSTLARLRPGAMVNLERAIPATGRFDGHLVLGHVDGTARVAAVRAEGRSQVVDLDVPEDLWPFVVPKGSITVDGVSLTVGPRVRAGRFELFLIPYTWEHTTLHALHPGDIVNVETDIIGRYVAHLLGREADPAGSGLDWATLQRAFGRGERG
jgi:riboflavin synthase